MIKLYIKDKEAFNTLLAVNGLSGKELAESADITPTYLSRILNKKQSVGKKTARKIAIKLNATIEDIFFISSVDKSFTKAKRAIG
ncbi:helix-turn-helix transcriptional regulator [Loigolactobacillus coryniformis]|uniref:helix-turn-helix transcriptional regulator n=1 Tax=Loigolactobacillus coryniformis TaxID=1610 RepID=UPI000553CFC6|nr:helix-turn-helix transcriptional regulator [Loigolactobacillus coryniformis]